MPDATALTLFIVAALALLVTPGPAVLFIVARSIEQGRGAGIVSTLGIGAGTLVHVAAAALGVSALLVSSALAFDVLKYVGAAYLIYLGIRRFADAGRGADRAELRREPLRRLFYQGMVVNLLNPKAAMFFFAFLPQFVDVERGGVARQVLGLGLLFVMLAIVTDSLWALLAGTLGQWLRERHGLLRAQRYVAGSVLVALGIATAVSGSRASG